MSQTRQRPNAAFILRRLLCGCCDKDREVIRSIDLSHSLLSEVPPEVYMCERTLEYLRLDSNHVVELPRQLFNCDELRVLSVTDNELNFIPPAISFLQNLQKLDISKNAVSTLPDNIRQCTSLTYLDVSINPLEKLPEGLVNVVSLQELYLTDVYLEFLPANFGKLVNLRILELRENSLSTLPKTMNRLIHLARLDIGYNEFQDLPEVVSSLQNLTELWIDGNHIKKLNPSIGQLRKMIHFDASHNNLENLPRDVGYWTRVQEFNVSNNELGNLPSTIGNMKNLIGLKLEENSLKALPETVGKLTHLEELMVTHNYLSHLPASIGLLRKLRIVTVDKNYLSEIPPELGSCSSLSILSLRGNRLSEIPAEIGHLSSLKVLNLVDNLIKYLPMSILKLEKLSALWLSNNQSQPLMPLQQDRDPDTNKNVLTCFMLPQQRYHPEPGPSIEAVETTHVPKVAPRHIYFAPNTGAPFEQPGRLTRAPTPYPKELRALAKHAKHVQKTLTVSQERPEEKVTHQVQGPLEIKEAALKIKTGTAALILPSATSVELTPRSVDGFSEPIVSPFGPAAEPTEIISTLESSVSSLPVAYESSPIIREAKNIRTDLQTGSAVHSPTPQIINVAPASAKETKVPPPYHIAAAYSVKAHFFNPSEYALPDSSNQSACSPSGDSSEQQKIISQSSASPAMSAGNRSEPSNSRRPYAGRSSFSYPTGHPKISDTYRTDSPTLSVSERSDSQNTHRHSRHSRVSPLPVMSSDESGSGEQQSTTDLSHFIKNSAERSENQQTSSLGERSALETTHSYGIQTHYSSSEGRGTASPMHDAGERSEQTIRSLSDYAIRAPVHEMDKYALCRPDDQQGEQLTIRSLGSYKMSAPQRSSIHEIEKYAIPENKGSSQSSVEKPSSSYVKRTFVSESTDAGSDSTNSSQPLSPGEAPIPQGYCPDSSGSLSPGEIRIPRSTHSLDVHPSRSIPSFLSSSVSRSAISLGTYTLQGQSSDDTNDQSEKTDTYSERGPFLNLDEFVSRTDMSSGAGTSAQATSSTPATSFEPSDSSSRSEPTSRSNFHLLTPPVPQPLSSTHSLSPIAEHGGSGSRASSDPIAPSVECDLGGITEHSDPSSELVDKTPESGSLTTITGQSAQSTQSSGTHSGRTVSPDPHEYCLPDSRSVSYSSHSGQSSQSQTARLTQFSQSLSAHSLQSPYQTFSPQSSQPLSAQSGHSSYQVLSPHLVQLPQILSAHSIQSSQVLSAHSVQSPQTLSGHLDQTPHQSSPVHSIHSIQSPYHSFHSPQLSSAHSVQSPQSLSAHSLQLAQSLHSLQSPQAMSVHSVHSPNLSLSSRSGHSVQLAQLVQSPHQPLSAHSVQTSQALAGHSGYSGRTSLSGHSVHPGHSARSSHSGQSSHSPYLSNTPQSTHSVYSRHSGQSAHATQSTETVDNAAADQSLSHRSNLNEPYICALHPCAVLDNDNVASDEQDNNFNRDDNKPRFFVQDKPVPGQNIVAPTPKRPNTGDKSSRIPYLTSPTMSRSSGIVTTSPASSTQFTSVITSPRSCRRDISIREVKSDTTISSGMKKTKIPAPNPGSKPVSPESSRTKRWVFGQHKNATVMNVLIQKNPDLGFSITEIPGKGIFIDDVKHQECLSVGDKILEVEGFDATILSKDEVMEILLAAGKNICMMVSHI